MRFFNFVFYCLHDTLEFIGHEGFFPDGLAYFATTILAWFNLLTIIKIMELVANRHLTNVVAMIVIYIFLLIGGYIYFFGGDRSKKITDDFASKRNLGLKKVGVAIYVIGSLVAYYAIPNLNH